MRLAVLIPAFNAGEELHRTLSSVAVDPTPFDVVVVDDGSQPPLAQPPAAGLHPVGLLRREVNGGVACALNTGLDWVLAHDYDAVARLDAGDLNAPTRLSKQRAFLEQHPEVALVGTWTSHVDERLGPLFVTRYPTTWDKILTRFHYRAPFSHTTCMIRVSALREVGWYDEHTELGEDYDLFWRIASRFPCANLPEVLVTRVESPRSLTHTRRGAMARMRLRLQWRHFSWWQLHSWLGVARSLLLFAVPSGFLLMVKRLIRAMA